MFVNNLAELQGTTSLTLNEIHNLQNHLKQEIGNAWRVQKQGGGNLNNYDYLDNWIMTLDYYEMVEPWEPELVGVKDGSSQATVIEKGFKNKQHYKTFMEIFANPNHFDSDEAMTTKFELECVKLKKDAILTDCLSFAPMNYQLVSERVYRILVKYSLGRNRFINARVEDAMGNRIEGYRFFIKRFLTGT